MSPRAEPDRGDGWPRQGDKLTAALREEAFRVAPGMVPEGPVLTGTLPEGRWVREQVLLRMGRCYRIVALAAEGVEDLDLMLVDPGGEPVAHDGSVGRAAALGADGSICLADSGLFQLRLKAFSGSGSYRARLMRRPLR